jgi:hypothetical protein
MDGRLTGRLLIPLLPLFTVWLGGNPLEPSMLASMTIVLAGHILTGNAIPSAFMRYWGALAPMVGATVILARGPSAPAPMVVASLVCFGVVVLTTVITVVFDLRDRR